MNEMMKRIVVTITAILLVSVAVAQDSLVLKDQQLATLIQQAVNNYPKIREMEIQLQSNDVKQELIRSNWLPTVQGDAMVSYVAPVPKVNFDGKNLQFAPNDNYNLAVGVNQLLYDFGKTRIQLERSQSEKKWQKGGIDLSKNAVAYQVSQAYFTVLFLNKAIAVQEGQIKALQENEKLIQAKIRNGDALEYDLLTTQVRIANARNRLKDLQSQQEQQLIALKLLTGEDQHGKIRDIAPADFSQMANSATWRNYSLELKQINNQLELLNINNQVIRKDFSPTVFGTATGGVKNGFVPDIRQMRLNGMVGVGISIPIFSANRPKLEQKMNQVSIDATRQSITTLEQQVEKDLARVNEDYRNLEEKLRNQEVLVKQAEKAFQLAQVRFREGLITSVELLTTQVAVEDAQLSMVQLQYQMQLDKIESHKIVGMKIW